jgi:hypothetical protein
MATLNTMFIRNANTPFNNIVFSCETISRMKKASSMHPTMVRLYKAAKELRDVEGQSALAALLNESPQLINNWERRGMSAAGMLKSARAIGCSSDWLANGKGHMGTQKAVSLTAHASNPEDLASPSTVNPSESVKNTLSPELIPIVEEMELALHGGWMTEDVITTLRRVLRLAAPSAKKPRKVHTEHHTLAEGTEGQQNERGRSARR